MTRPLCLLLALTAVTPAAAAAESIWLEAEHLDGIRGHCWPMGKPEMKQTKGHWGISGPGWAAEWTQGGESGFLSIAAGPDDDRAAATKTLEVPVDGKYFLWVRYGDWREKAERFQVKLEQDRQTWLGRFGEKPLVDEDNEMKLYWGWVFVWDGRPVSLRKGPVKLTLMTTTKDPEARQVDVLVLTTDPDYRPRVKDRPRHPTWDVLAGYRKERPADLEALSRKRLDAELPAAWKLRTFRDQGFRYLWNVSAGPWLMSDDPKRVRFPYNLRDADVLKEFEQKYGGRDDVPIFSDPRIVPTFHGSGPTVFAADPKKGAPKPEAGRFAKWLDDHPDRFWATMMNYAGDQPIGDKGVELFQKYRDRYVGAIAGESLGYFHVDPKAVQQSNPRTRREVAAAFTRAALEANAAKYRRVYGKDLDKNAYADVISCLSVGNIAFVPLCYDWGARTVGYESAAIPSSVLGMRWAFMRGAARQHGGLTATYRSSNFGDAATMFSVTQSYTGPKNIYDNFYSVYSGAGMTWYKMDVWYQYQAGSSLFYHEQGFDEFWKPGGTTAAGIREVQLSPKGLIVDRFLRLTAKEPDRGHPFTPVAFLVDYAHGWEPAPYAPYAFKGMAGTPDFLRYGDHERMLEQYFWTAFHPIGPESEKPTTATNEVYVPGVFGDVFDVIFAYPDTKKWRTLDTYPVVIAVGDVELTEAEGRRLAEYVEKGGTLVVADTHLTGPGVAALKVPEAGPQAESEGYRWLTDAAAHPSQRFRYRPLTGGRPLATTADGKVFCAAYDRGQGRLIYLAVPRGLGIDRQAVPAVARLLAHLTRGVMPVEVEGDVEWLVNRTEKGWLVTLLNPAGQSKPQQGITPTDFRENRRVTIRARVPVQKARDRLLPDDILDVRKDGVTLEVPAGGVRIIELH